MSTTISKPKRSLTAYNFFFLEERQRILESIPSPRSDQSKSPSAHGKIGFADLTRNVASKWRNLEDSDKKYYKQLAKDDWERYEMEMSVWKQETERLEAKLLCEQYAQNVENACLITMIRPSPPVPAFCDENDDTDTTLDDSLEPIQLREPSLFEIPSLNISQQSWRNHMNVSQLVRSLDDESIDFLIDTFRQH